MRISKRFSSSRMKTGNGAITPRSKIRRAGVWEAATVIQFRRNSHVVEDLTDWRAASAHLPYRLVFSQPDMFPAADAPCFADLLSASDSRAIQQTQRPG